MDAASAPVTTETPADRSNSPPIISSAPPTATMPIDELAYSTVDRAGSVRNGSASTKKKMKIAIAAASDPISGRVSRVDSSGFLGRSTSVVGVGGDGWVVTGEDMARSSGGRMEDPGGAGTPGSPWTELAGVVLGVRDDLLDVALVDKRWAGEHRAAAAHVVAVGQVQPQRRHGHVALHVGLLVDGEHDPALLDRLGRVDVQVERRELRLAPGVGDGLERGESPWGTERHDVRDRRVLLQLGADRRAHRRQIGALHLDVLGVREARLHPGAAGLQGDVTLLLDHADGLLPAVLGEAPPGGLTGEALVRPEVHLRAELLVLVNARVERRDRDAVVGRRLGGRADLVQVGERHGEAVDLAVDRVLHQGRLLGPRLGVRVLQLDVVCRRGILSTSADPVPERVAGLLVRDHRDRVALGADGAAGPTAPAACFLLGTALGA